MLKLIKNAQLFAPESLGPGHILIAGGKIVYIGSQVPALPDSLDVETMDAQGARLIPGLIDSHAHITGGGGESGAASRVPAPLLSDFTRAGVTSVVGVLGTDDLTRNTETLVTQAYALREQGLSAWCHTGGYHLPLTTLTGSARSDIVFVDPVIGVGELAVSDHRSSQPTLNELLRVASEAHVAGLMTGKAGILHLHMGDGKRRLALIREALQQSELPARVFNPTHINRNLPLYEQALSLADRGCYVDLTAFPEGHFKTGLTAAEGFMRFHAGAHPAQRLSISSDGGGCLPDFDDQGNLISMGIGRSQTLPDTLKQLLEAKQALSDILPCMTANPADLLRLKHKGRLRVGHDADLVILDDQHRVSTVMANGCWHIRNTRVVIKGSYE